MWNDIQDTVTNLKSSEVYQHLPNILRAPFEKQAKEFENLHMGILDNTIRLAPLQEQTKETIQEPNELGEAIQAFDTLKRMQSIVRFQQNVYDFTEMTSDQLTMANLTTTQLAKIEAKILSIAEKVGWKDVMERVTKIIRRVRNDNCNVFLITIEESGDESAAPGLAKIFTDKQFDSSLRWLAGHSVSKLKNKSVAPSIVEVLTDWDATIMAKRAVDTLRILDNRSVAKRLVEIRNTIGIPQDTRLWITHLLQDWEVEY